MLLPVPANASTLNPTSPLGIGANFWTVALGASGSGLSQGTLAVNNVGGSRHLIVDLVGFYAPSNAATLGHLKLLPQPARVLDTRPGTTTGIKANGLAVGPFPLTC